MFVAVAFGSNLGDAPARVRQATERVGKFVELSGISSLWASAPMYVEDQPEFINACAAGHTDFGPYELLRRFKAIEEDLGRVPRRRYGPREVDVDLLMYGPLQLAGPTLLLPHPRMDERGFVLQPLAEIQPELQIPGLGSISTLLDRLPENRLRRIEDATVFV
jgi:2-amino-4-hydroxy-6-hydroxymethyldihydropteridine diphosphokinase